VSKVVLITGGFDPIHSGHISYIRAARALGDVLIIGVNSDNWLVRKKGKAFLPSEERLTIMSELRSVDVLIVFDDSDGTAIDAIKQVLDMYPEDEVIFANGGDRTLDNIPEMVVESERLHFVFGVGGEDKKNSSSWILAKYREEETDGKNNKGQRKEHN
jgi:cytidyltransferase-like protein